MLPASLSPRLLTGMLVWGTLQGTPENSVQALWAPRVGAGGSQPGRPRPPVPGSALPGHRVTVRRCASAGSLLLLSGELPGETVPRVARACLPCTFSLTSESLLAGRAEGKLRG